MQIDFSDLEKTLNELIDNYTSNYPPTDKDTVIAFLNGMQIPYFEDTSYRLCIYDNMIKFYFIFNKNYSFDKLDFVVKAQENIFYKKTWQ